MQENVQGLRRGAMGLLVLSIIICFAYAPAGVAGIILSLLWGLSAKPAAITTTRMEAAVESGDNGMGCFWSIVTVGIGLVVFLLGIGVVVGAMNL